MLRNWPSAGLSSAAWIFTRFLLPSPPFLPTPPPGCGPCARAVRVRPHRASVWFLSKSRARSAAAARCFSPLSSLFLSRDFEPPCCPAFCCVPVLGFGVAAVPRPSPLCPRAVAAPWSWHGERGPARCSRGLRPPKRGETRSFCERCAAFPGCWPAGRIFGPRFPKPSGRYGLRCQTVEMHWSRSWRLSLNKLLWLCNLVKPVPSLSPLIAAVFHVHVWLVPYIFHGLLP